MQGGPYPDSLAGTVSSTAGSLTGSRLVRSPGVGEPSEPRTLALGYVVSLVSTWLVSTW